MKRKVLTHTDKYKYQLIGNIKDTFYYRCARHFEGCRARLILKGTEFKAKGIHSCYRIKEPNQAEIPYEVSRKFWVKYVSEKAFHAECAPKQIYDNVLQEMKTQFDPAFYDIPSKEDVFVKISEVNRIKGTIPILEIIQPDLRCLLTGGGFLKRFWMGEIHGELHQIVIYATEESFSFLQTDSPTLTELTLLSIPSPFRQCIIIMILDANLRKYIPCVYALVTGMNENIYLKMFEEIREICQDTWNPREISTICKKALISAIRNTFNKCSVHILSYHFKKRILEKAKKYIKNDEVVSIIDSNIVLLTILPIEEIDRGIEYIKNKISEKNSDDEFWKYFKNAWVQKYTIDMWNAPYKHESGISAISDQAIEDYHLKQYNYCGQQRPSLWNFISTVRNAFEYYYLLRAQTPEKLTPSDPSQECSYSSLLLSDYTEWKKSQQILI